MNPFKVKVTATVAVTHPVLAYNESDAQRKANIMFLDDCVHKVIATEFDVQPQSDHSPVNGDLAKNQPHEP